MQRWLHAGPRDKASAYRAWQVAESNRRRAIKVAVPFNERYDFLTIQDMLREVAA